MEILILGKLAITCFVLFVILVIPTTILFDYTDESGSEILWGIATFFGIIDLLALLGVVVFTVWMIFKALWG